MSARSISRLARTGFAAGALTVALSVPAFAVTARDSSGTPIPRGIGAHAAQAPVANASGNFTAGTDVAAPDQQNPVVDHGNFTAGTDVAAPDQQSRIPTRSTLIVSPSPARPLPHGIASPHNVSASPSSGFQWDDAGIGAGGALVIALTALGGVWIVRRRHEADRPLAA